MKNESCDTVEMIRRAFYPLLALCATGLLFRTIVHTNLLLRNNYVPDRTIRMEVMTITTLKE